MANVKITTLTNLQAPADADRFIIDDISETETKSVTFANLKAQIDTIAISNTNTVSSNVDAVESRRASNAVIQTAIEARRTANVVIQTAIEARRVANVTEQTAIEARRVANIAGAISSVLTTNLTADRLLTSDSSGKISVSTLAPGDVGASLGNLSNVNTDFGILDSANLTVDAFTVAIGDLTVFDMLTAPAGEVDAIDLVAFS